MSTKTTIAIIGLGHAAKGIHIPAFKKVTDLEIIAGYDPAVDTETNSFAFPVFDNVLQLLDECRPDIVAIATPTETHFEYCKQALESGCHVFCEKPFTPTVEQARKLVALSASTGLWIVVNNAFRFMEIYQTAKNQIGTDTFGELLFVSANQTFHTTAETEAGWRGEDPQRTCKEFGIHVLDLCRYFFAEEPIRISAKMPKPGNPEGPDYLNLIQLDFSGQRTAFITLDRLTRGRHRYLDLRLDGTNATIETEFGGTLEIKAGIRGGDRKPYLNMDISMGGRAFQYQGEKHKKIASDPLDNFAAATAKLMQAYLDAIDTGTTPPCSARDNIKTLALTYAAYESAETGRPVAFASHWNDANNE